MTTIHDIEAHFESWAPQEWAAHWDSVGIQIGDPGVAVSEILVALEVDEDVLAYLDKKQNVLVVTHHPIFFKPLKCLRYDQDMGQIIKAFTAGSHQLFTAHTNLDRAPDGVNDQLMRIYGIDPKQAEPITDFGGYIENPSTNYVDLLDVLPCVQQGAINERPIKRLGVCAGSGHGLIADVLAKKIDTFITGEISYHDHVQCRMNHVRVLTLGHKESEVLICPVIKSFLDKLDLACPVSVIPTNERDKKPA